MSDIRLLYFTSQQHRVYRWKGGRLELEASFAADEPDLSEFSRFAKSTSKSRYYVLADLAGEDFHEEKIPWLRGSDRDAIIQRRLAQRYRDTRLAATSTLGTVAGERKDERLLLASFTNTQQFSPWLDALSEAGVRLAGVYSAPFAAPAIVSRIGDKLSAGNSRVFLVSLNSTGLRQSFVEDGKLRFSRLEQLGDVSPEALPAFVRSETFRLYQYLGSLRLLPRDGPPLAAVVVTPPGQQAAFEQALVSDTRLTFRTIELPDAAKALGIKKADGISAEQLYLHSTAKRTPKAQFASNEDRRTYLVWQFQRYIVAAGVAGLAAISLFSGAKWLEVMNLRDQAATQAQESSIAAREYERITSAFPVTQTSTDNLRVTVDEFRGISARTTTLEPALVHLSKALEKFPEIEIDQLVWRTDKPVEVKPPAGTPQGAAAGPTTAASKPKPEALPPSRSYPEMAQFLEISGRVSAVQRSDYRSITAQVQRFADELSKDSAYRIVNTQLPFDLTPGGTLSGDIGENTGGDVPRFSIILTRRFGA